MNSVSHLEQTMGSEIETAFKEFIKAIVKEVVAETRTEAVVESSSVAAEVPVQLLTPREAAQRLSISTRYLYTLSRSGVLPCVRIGQSVRYSVATLQNWIRQSESTEQPIRPATTKQLEKANVVTKSKPASKVIEQPRPKKQSKPVEAKTTKQQTSTHAKAKTLQARQKAKQDDEERDRKNPFAKLLAEVGIDRNSLPPITNGELMRISGTDIVQYSGWMYHNRPLPQEAREKLKKHFLAIVSDSSQK
jgi:excisionase family DNA binding protein